MTISNWTLLLYIITNFVVISVIIYCRLPYMDSIHFQLIESVNKFECII